MIDGVQMKVRNKDRLFKKLRAMVPEAEKELAAANGKSAEEVAAQAQRFAPVSQAGSHGNPPGALRDSIVVTYAGQPTPPYSHPGGSFVVPDAAAAVTVGNSDVRYGHLVEYGTQQAPAQPFFWPSVRLNRKKIKSRASRAINKAAKKVSQQS